MRGHPSGLAAALLLGLAGLAAPRAAAVEVPVDIGVGPALYLVGWRVPGDPPRLYGGPVYDDQPLHYGVKISVEAVLDRAWLDKNKARVPKKYRTALGSTSEVRIGPSIFIPDALLVSPKYRSTGLYGATWRPLAVGLPLARGERGRVGLSAGLLVTAALLHSDAIPDTFFLRPGLDLALAAEVRLSSTFLLGFGWSSGFYVPQVVGTFASVAPLEDALFHFGQAFVQLHYRAPFDVKL